MNVFFLQAPTDTLAQAAQSVLKNGTNTATDVSLFSFVLKGGVFLIPIAVLLFYTIYLIAERFLYIKKASRHDAHLLKDIQLHLTDMNIPLAINATERTNTASGIVLKEGLQSIGRPIAEIESNMEKRAQIEIGEMERRLGHLGLIAGIAPTLGFIGTISGVIKIFYSISVTEDISIGAISGGLYEKMISSGAGLIVGIIAFMGYHLLNGMIDHFLLQTQKFILKFITLLQRPHHADKTK